MAYSSVLFFSTLKEKYVFLGSLYVFLWNTTNKKGGKYKETRVYVYVVYAKWKFMLKLKYIKIYKEHKYFWQTIL